MKKLTGLSRALIDLDQKIIHISIGPLSLNIPGDQFIPLRHGKIRYFGHPPGSKGIFHIFFHKRGNAVIKGFKTNLNGISNPISIAIGIEAACWKSTTTWRKFLDHRKVIYRRP